MNSVYSEQLFAQTPFGKTVLADEVVDTLSFFDDWEERYRYIIDLGKQLPSFPVEMQTADRIIHGCQSQVWLEVAYDAQNNLMQLTADSDAIIVRGLVAIVLAALNNQSPEQILQYDMDSYFASLDLLKHLSPTRGNGVRAMVERIRKEAQKLTK